MKNRKRIVSILISTLAFTLIGLAGTLASAQSATTNSSSTAPVAFVYVSVSPTSTTNEIYGFTASATGALTATPGSPYVSQGTYMALNSQWLFETNGVNIVSREIGAEGALHGGPSVNAQQYNEDPKDGGPFNLFLDHTGQSLYDGDIYIDGANNGYQAWNIVSSTGQVEFNGLVGPYSVNYGNPLSFIGNNEYAYSANCVKGFQAIYGYKRGGDGKLTNLNISPFIPTPTISGSAYCPYLAAADTTDHLAIPLTPFEPYMNVGPPQIAVYTADASGNLTTTSTATNMPTSKVVSVNDIKMAPSGKVVALAGSSGVQLFHWNGAAGASNFTGLLTTHEIDQMYWDYAGHLYAISQPEGLLYVWTVTTTTATPAPGSPHSIKNVDYVAVLPK